MNHKKQSRLTGLITFVLSMQLISCRPVDSITPSQPPIQPTVQPTAPIPTEPIAPTPTTRLENLALEKSITASQSTSNQPPENAIDGNPDTAWRSGGAPEQWIQIDLGAPSVVNEIHLMIYQPDPGNTAHSIFAGSSEGNMKPMHDFSQATMDRQDLVFKPIVPLEDIHYLRILTTQAPGWVSWREISVYGTTSGAVIETTAQPTSMPVADAIYYNANILTMESNAPVAEAMAIKGDKILAVGERDQVFQYQGTFTSMIDLQGLTLTPGFIDSHQHRIGDRWLYADTPLPVSQVLYETLKEGYTSISELYVNSDRLNELIALDEQGQLPLRVFAYLNMLSDYNVENWWQAYQPLQRFSPFFEIAGLKITLDREWGQQIFMNDQNSLDVLVQSATSLGWQIATHAFSPAANQLILNAYANALNGSSNDALRLRIEHIGVLTDPELQQMADLHIIGSVQLVSTGGWPDDTSFQAMIPAEQAPLTARWRDLINAGILLIGNTDAPWCCTSWREGIRNTGFSPSVPQAFFQGMTMTTFTNREPSAWQAANVVTAEEALQMMTINAAYATHQEERIGSLHEGKYADLVILSDNPLSMTADQMLDLSVVMTVVGGKVQYCSPGFEEICTPTSSP